MKKILIIHPEGNITNNPGLSSIVELLSEHYEIYIFQPKRPSIYQDIKWGNVHSIFYNAEQTIYHNNFTIKNKICELNTIDFGLIIGIDEGIVLADTIARRKKIPLGLISYELLFPKTSQQRHNKQKEKNACKSIAFAICQDPIRSYILSKENNIPIEKIMNIPISESYKGPYKKSNFLKQKLSIPEEKKIALYIGSVSHWTLTNELIKATINWPDPWVLVIHPRYGIEEHVKPLVKMIQDNNKIYLSSEPVHQTDELEKILCSADIGLALYTYDLFSLSAGENILFIGLSSGKVSSFLKYGIPMVVNTDTNIAKIISDYELGKTIVSVENISFETFSGKYLNQTKLKCTDFFLKYLDFTLYKNTLLALIENTIKAKNVLHIIKENNKILDLNLFSSENILKLYYSINFFNKEMQFSLVKSLFRRLIKKDKKNM